jgi:nickel-type superoxide dismutase maturation protease
MLPSMRLQGRRRVHLIQATSGRNPALRRALGRAGALAGAALVAAGLSGLRWRRVVVEGDSMLPTLEPGDRLLVLAGRRAPVGSLVALADPRDPGRVLVKRVAAWRHGGVEVRGDNPAASTDSRHFGPVAAEALLGRVVRRYAPAGRRGPVH